MSSSAMTIVRVKEIPWEDRVNVDNWPSRAGMYYDNRDLELCIRLSHRNEHAERAVGQDPPNRKLFQACGVPTTWISSTG